MQHKRHVGEFMQADVDVARGAGHAGPGQQPGTIGERADHRAGNQSRADLPRHEPAQGRQFSILAERVIQQERQGVQQAHFFLKNTNSADFITDSDSRLINSIKVKTARLLKKYEGSACRSEALGGFLQR